MKRYGVVASGGGYRSFYTAGVLVWLKQHEVPVVHLTSTSSGNNIVLDYLLWDWEAEALPPVLTKTMRLSVKDIYDVFSNFAGLQPALVPNGSHLFAVNKGRTQQALQLNDHERQALLRAHLKRIRWDIYTTNLTERRSERFSVNEMLSKVDKESLRQFMDIFLAGITTIPYFKARKLDGKYYVEGGYTDNTPLRALFSNPDVDEIIAVDFTDYDYHEALDRVYGASRTLVFALNGIDMNLLVNDIQWCLPNAAVLSQAVLINQFLETTGQSSIKIGDKTFYHKPLHILRPKNLESMTISLKDIRAQKVYFETGKQETEALMRKVANEAQVEGENEAPSE